MWEVSPGQRGKPYTPGAGRQLGEPNWAPSIPAAAQEPPLTEQEQELARQAAFSPASSLGSPPVPELWQR